MSGRKILVTGAGGFIGRALGNHLAAHGHRVTGVDLKHPPGSEAVQFDLRVADFRDQAVMDPLLRGAEVVFHLASAHLSVKLDKAEYWNVNVHSLPRLLEAAYARGVARFIHVSSVGVYGNLKAWPANEDTACTPQSIYGETKLAGEAVVKRLSERSGLPAVILRPTWVYGPACQRMKKLLRALRTRTFVMVGSGENVRHPIYIDDLLGAFDLAMQCEAAAGETFIAGGEEAITTREAIRTLCDVFGLKEPLLHIPYRVGRLVASGVETACSRLGMEPPVARRTLEFFDTNNAFDISKARRLLGFTPAFSFREGLCHGFEAFEAAA